MKDLVHQRLSGNKPLRSSHSCVHTWAGTAPEEVSPEQPANGGGFPLCMWEWCGGCCEIGQTLTYMTSIQGQLHQRVICSFFSGEKLCIQHED